MQKERFKASIHTKILIKLFVKMRPIVRMEINYKNFPCSAIHTYVK